MRGAWLKQVYMYNVVTFMSILTTGCFKIPSVENRINCDQYEEDVDRTKEKSPGCHVLSIPPYIKREYEYGTFLKVRGEAQLRNVYHDVRLSLPPR